MASCICYETRGLWNLGVESPQRTYHPLPKLANECNGLKPNHLQGAGDALPSPDAPTAGLKLKQQRHACRRTTAWQRTWGIHGADHQPRACSIWHSVCMLVLARLGPTQRLLPTKKDNRRSIEPQKKLNGPTHPVVHEILCKGVRGTYKQEGFPHTIGNYVRSYYRGPQRRAGRHAIISKQS